MTEQISEEKKKSLRGDVRQRTMGYILTALGLVAGLAWNDAITAIIKFFFPFEGSGVIIKVVYAVIVTVLIVMLSNTLMRVLGSKEDK